VKVVLDTNVYISAFVFGGRPREILRRAIWGQVALFISRSILDEIETVLVEKFRWAADRVALTVETIETLATMTQPSERIHQIKEDPDDDRILECAIAVKAEAIVSGDNHLRQLGDFRGIPILSPAEFLTRLKR
jgi:putative PIN family toxin of toxin-antitoxin system